MSGLIVEPISYFPGNIINTKTFILVFHFPAQVLRGLCAIVIAVASLKSLDIFKYELIDRLSESYENIKKFSQNASHQIKTPLTIMRLQIHRAIKNEQTSSKYIQTLKSIDMEIGSLQELVNNLLLLTRIQNISIKDTFVTTEIDNILLEVFEEYNVVAKSKGVSFNIEHFDFLKLKVEPTLIKILFSNLIDNAIKYTTKGKSITISLKGLVFMVKDEGIGIAQEKIDKIFGEFYRVNSPLKSIFSKTLS